MAARLTGVCRKIILQGAGDLGHHEPCTTDLQMHLELPISEPLANTTALIVALGITFGTLENKQFINVLTGKALNIVKIM